MIVIKNEGRSEENSHRRDRAKGTVVQILNVLPNGNNILRIIFAFVNSLVKLIVSY